MPRRREERRSLRSVNWAGLGQVTLLLLVMGGAWLIHRRYESRREEWNKVEKWLSSYGLTNLQSEFAGTDYVSMDGMVELDVEQHEFLSKLPEDTKIRMWRAINAYKDQMDMKLWLNYHALDHHYEKLLALGVISLKVLAEQPDAFLQELSKYEGSHWDYPAFKNLIKSLRSTLPSREDLQLLRSQKIGGFFRANRRSFTGVFLLVVFFIGMVAFTKINQAYVAFQNSNHLLSNTATTDKAVTGATSNSKSFFNFLSGNWLAPGKTVVIWQSWDEPQEVGKAMTFKLKFFQQNKRPYPVSNADKIKVEIVCDEKMLPPSTVIGGSGADDVHTASVTFTAHLSGNYNITVRIAGSHINGSPFCRRFIPGTMDPLKSSMVVQSSVFVVSAGILNSIKIDPRDKYGNFTWSRKDDDLLLTLEESGSGAETVPSCQVHKDQYAKKLALQVQLAQVGCYAAQVLYQGVKLKNADFTVIVLTTEETAAVDKAVSKRSYPYYEARLLSSLNPDHNEREKPKKVFVYISPKQLTIREYYWRIIPKRLFAFRVCPYTKFQFQGMNNQYNVPIISIEDGSRQSVQLAAKDRNMIAATYTSFLLKNIGGSETFKHKQDYFYSEVRKFHSKHMHSQTTLRINRDKILESSMRATKYFSSADWCKNYEIVFHGEEGLDWGGLRREWFEVLCREMFDPEASGLFLRFKDDPQALVQPNPKRPPTLKSKYYEFAGRVVGKCLYESALGGTYRQLVKARFTRSFLAQLIGLSINYKYFEQDDPDLYTSKIKYIEENDVEDMELTFVEEEYTSDGRIDKTVELIPNGARTPVTNSNKLKYLNTLAQHRLIDSVHREVESFLVGLNDLIPDNLLCMFDENELELLMCGTGEYSITDFKYNHVVCGSEPGFNQTMEWFWTIVCSFTQEEMARLLQFTTGCSQLPPDGFSELNPKFQISASHTYGNLPTAHTCFNQLCLPNYPSLDQMHQMLLLAINEGNQGFAMV